MTPALSRSFTGRLRASYTGYCKLLCEREVEALGVRQRASDLGEFGLIRRLTADLTARADVVVSIGDDAAVLRPSPGRDLVATIDAQVEGRHFLRDVSNPEDIGYKALAVNLSDIAAMGATPQWALVSLLLPPDTPVSLLDGVYRGMRALADEFAVSLVGGNVAATDGPLVVDVALLGAVDEGAAALRAGASVGDAVLVTGLLGAAAAGVLTLGGELDQSALDRRAVQEARRAMSHPEPLVREGQAIARSGLVSAMLDISDGLAADLGHLCEASHVGATLNAAAIPIHPAARAVAGALGCDPSSLALSGGEDYQLLFTARREHVAALAQILAEMGCVVSVIGEITDDVDHVSLRAADGTQSPLAPGGWDHLRSPGAVMDRD